MLCLLLDHQMPGPEPSAPPSENHTNHDSYTAPPGDPAAHNNSLYPDLPDPSAPPPPPPSEQSVRPSQPPYPTEDSASFPTPQPPPPSQTVNQEELRRRRLARFQ